MADPVPGRSSAPQIAAAREEVVAVLARLGSDVDGLTTTEARRRRKVHGPNKVAEHRRMTGTMLLGRAVLNPLALLLAALAGLAFLGGDPAAGGIMVAMLVIGVGLRFGQEPRAEAAVETLRGMIRIRATVLRDGAARELPIEDLVPGDVVLLAAGDMVPADLRLVTGTDLHLAQAVFTGESFPVEKRAGIDTSAGRPPLELPNICWLGTSVESGSGRGMVVATGRGTMLGLVSAALEPPEAATAFDVGMARFTWLILTLVALLVPLIFVVNVFTRGDWGGAALFAVAVGLTPEMLPLIVSVCLSQGALAMARRRVIVKHVGSIQNLGAMDVLGTDKTGTLTLDRIILERHCDVRPRDDPAVLALAWLNSHFQTGLRSVMDRAILDHEEFPGATPADGGRQATPRKRRGGTVMMLFLLAIGLFSAVNMSTQTLRTAARVIDAQATTGVDDPADVPRVATEPAARDGNRFDHGPRLPWPDRSLWPTAEAEPAWLALQAVILLVMFLAILITQFGKGNQDLARVESSLEWLFTFPVSATTLFVAKIGEYVALNGFLWLLVAPFLFCLFLAAGRGWLAVPLAIGFSVLQAICMATVRLVAECWLRRHVSPGGIKNVQAACTILGMSLLMACFAIPTNECILRRSIEVGSIAGTTLLGTPSGWPAAACQRGLLVPVVAGAAAATGLVPAAGLWAAGALTRDGLLTAGALVGSRQPAARRARTGGIGVAAAMAVVGVFLHAFLAAGIGTLATDPLETDPRRRAHPDCMFMFMLLAGFDGHAIDSPSLGQKLAQLVLSIVLAVAVWQRVRDQLPYLLDPVSAPPPRLGLADGMVAAVAFFVLQGIITVILTLSEAPRVARHSRRTAVRGIHVPRPRLSRPAADLFRRDRLPRERRLVCDRAPADLGDPRLRPRHRLRPRLRVDEDAPRADRDARPLQRRRDLRPVAGLPGAGRSRSTAATAPRGVCRCSHGRRHAPGTTTFVPRGTSRVKSPMLYV